MSKTVPPPKRRPGRPGNPGWERITVTVSPEAAKRIRMQAASQGTEMGAIVTELVLEHLPDLQPAKAFLPRAQGTVPRGKRSGQ